MVHQLSRPAILLYYPAAHPNCCTQATSSFILPWHLHALQEKNRLLTDLKRLKEHYAKYEPTILELKRKYEGALRDKMLLSLERDRSKDMVGRAAVLSETVWVAWF